MPIQHLGTIPAQTPALTQLLQGAAGGLQTGMGYYQQAQQQKDVLKQLNLEQMDKTATTAWEMWNLADESGKSAIERGIKENPELLALMEDRFYWVGGPEGGFIALAPPEADLPTFKATKLGDDVLLYNESDPSDTHVISAAEEPKETKWVEGEAGYFAPQLADGTLGETVYVGPEKATTDIHVYEQAYGLIYVDESDPSNPTVIKQVLKPTEEKTTAELLGERNERIKAAQTAVFNFLRIKYPESWMDIMDEKARVRIGSQLAVDYRERFKEELIIRSFSETDASKIASGSPFPMSITEVAAGWVAAKGRPDRRAEIEMMVKNNPLLLADAEEHPEVWDAEAGGFVEPLEEMGILDILLEPGKVREHIEELLTPEDIEKWKELQGYPKKGEPTKVPAEPAKVPIEPKLEPTAPVKEGVLYTPEIDEQVEADKAYAEKNPGSLEALQTFLKEKGYWDYELTGKWTDTLEDALREFYRDQVKKGL
jgi:hypothetical protein